MLVQCDPSIKAIIVQIDAENNNAFIVLDIDDETVLIQNGKHDELKTRLKDVSIKLVSHSTITDQYLLQALSTAVREPEQSESEG